jgi:hypothetical protein
VPCIDVVRDSVVVRTPRVMQLEGLFDLPPNERSELRWSVILPIEDRPWNVGLIVGPSGAGKSTIARELFGDAVVKGFDWPDGKSLVDGFPAGMSVKEIAELLSSVGLASVTTWVRPFATLSTGEQFRASVARAMAEAIAKDDSLLLVPKLQLRNALNAKLQLGARSGNPSSEAGASPAMRSQAGALERGEPETQRTRTSPGRRGRSPSRRVGEANLGQRPLDGQRSPHPTLPRRPGEGMEEGAFANSPLLVIDEFTSVVDRTVAKIGSAAVAKAVRARKIRFVAVTCHYDVAEWLCPDWVYEPASGDFQWRSLQRRPSIELEIRRADARAWKLFHRHHYLSGELSPSARCFVGLVEGAPAVFTAVLSFPHPTRPGWREHRTVCLPDFQGVGIGNAFSAFIASLFKSTGKPYRSVTGSPAMIHHRAKSPLWKMTRPPSRVSTMKMDGFERSSASGRFTASFEYVGPARRKEAAMFGL